MASARPPTLGVGVQGAQGSQGGRAGASMCQDDGELLASSSLGPGLAHASSRRLLTASNLTTSALCAARRPGVGGQALAARRPRTQRYLQRPRPGATRVQVRPAQQRAVVHAPAAAWGAGHCEAASSRS